MREVLRAGHSAPPGCGAKHGDLLARAAARCAAAGPQHPSGAAQHPGVAARHPGGLHFLARWRREGEPRSWRREAAPMCFSLVRSVAVVVSLP